MNQVDFIILAVLVLSTLWGLKAGAIRAFGNIVGTIASAILAWKFLEPTVQFLAPWFGSTILRQVVFYLILFGIISKLIGLLVYLFEKLFGLVSWLPFADGANKLIGGVIGFFEGAVLCLFGVLTAAYFAQYVVINPSTTEALKTSRLATPIVKITPALFFLLPKEINFFPNKETEQITEENPNKTVETIETPE